MTIDPQVLRAEQHDEIGHIVMRDAEVLMERWSARAVAEQPQASRVHSQTLRDDLPSFLRTLGNSLANSTDGHALPHWNSAANHGEQRWEAGWSLAEVVRDYQILRLVIFEHLERMMERSLRTRESQAIGLALDEAITAAVATYVRHRDEHIHKLEQEKVEQARLAAEQLSQQTIALREADQRKNEFLATLAHELRNPLAPILNSIEVLRIVGPKDAAVLQAREIVERQVKQMVRLVDDLLDVTRIAQAKIELRKTSFDLAVAVSQAVQTTAQLFKNQRHHLTVNLPTAPVMIEADQARIVQVLVNLLNNAAKYTEPEGNIELSAARDNAEIVVHVRDNGVGIEPEMIGRIFDLFTQVDRSAHRAQGGLGIGLTLVRQLVALHGGKVTVTSDGPGKGSEFTLRLPASGTQQAKGDPS